MLVLDCVQINMQRLGSILGIFLVSLSKIAIEQRYYSFWNHEATGGELEWWSNTVALFWIHSCRKGTADEKLKRALRSGALSQLLATNTKGTNPWPIACKMAEERYSIIDHVTWFETANIQDMFALGDSVIAEKPNGDFSDVLESVLTRKGVDALDARKNDEESNCEDVRLESANEIGGS